MSNHRLKYLLDNYIAHKISPEEEQELLHLIASGKYDQQIKEYMADEWQSEYAELISKEQSNRILNAVFRHEPAKIIPLKRTSTNRILWVAASLLLILATADLVLTNRNSSKSVVSAGRPQTASNDVMPGTSGAILKLEDGSSIVLDSASNGKLAQQANTLV
ncbi:MAG: hypothetical protein ACXVBX_17420, partial [Flavisolibacter sp.]